jgi:regulator of sigma E protease
MNDPQSQISSLTPEPKPPAPSEPQAKSTVALQIIIGVAVVAFLAVKYPLMLRSGLIFIFTLSVLVFVHEWGHYQFARWAGMKVNRFALGFPPWIFTKRVNDIDYSLGALPIGGMVDIAGLGSEEEMVSTGKGEKVANATREARPDTPFGEKQFQDAGLGWRFWTLFAGPMMNFIFALIVFALMFSLVGVPDEKSVNNRVDIVYPGMPAFKAGIKAGDRMIAVNGVRTEDVNKLRELIRSGNGKPVSITIEREGKEIQSSLTPHIEPELQADGVTTTQAAIIGVMFSRVTEYERVGLLQGKTGFWDGAIGYGLRGSYDLAERIAGLLSRVVTLRLTPDDKRNIGGPVKIAQTIDYTSHKSWQETILLAAALSVNLGLMNLLPFPALDGGRILFLAYELVMRRPFDPRREGLVHAIGIVLLLTFMLLITVRDVLPMFG